MTISKYFTHPPFTPKKDQPYDPQRRRMYRMEREFDGMTIGTTTDKKTLESIVQHACNKYRVPKPKFVVGRDKTDRMGYVDYDAGVLFLNARFYGQNTQVLLHELAHWMVDNLFEDTDQDEVIYVHGAEFACIYMHMLNAYRVLPDFAFRHFAEKWKIQIADLKDPYQR